MSNVDHCISVINPVHRATQSFPMTGLRGVFKDTVGGLVSRTVIYDLRLIVVCTAGTSCHVCVR